MKLYPIHIHIIISKEQDKRIRKEMRDKKRSQGSVIREAINKLFGLQND